VKTVLFGWELGANLGHAKPLAEIARRIARADTRVFLAASDLLSARVAFSGVDATLLQSPIWPPHRHFGSETGQANYLDILVNIGFADSNKLSAVVAGWLSLIDLVRPAAIVADHSPGLLVSAHIRDIPVVQVGTCFTMPPMEYGRFPPIRADRGPIAAERDLLTIARETEAAFGHSGPRTLLEYFRTHTRVVYGCPELDCYASFRREPLHLPPEPLPSFVEPPTKPRLFAYLGSEMPKIDELVQTLTELDVPVEAYLRGEIAPLGTFLRLAGHTVHDEPPSLADVLPNASHVLSAGGALTSHAALAAGRPVLALALHGEAQLNVDMLAKAGMGKELPVWTDGRALKNEIVTFLNDHAMLRSARHCAKVAEIRTQPRSVEAIENAVNLCLGAASKADVERQPVSLSRSPTS
jgi:UDP:flavonoid glycosyltransferase YjiC (YdhE family)